MGCIPPILYAVIVPGVVLAMWIGFCIGRAWERLALQGAQDDQ